MSKRPHWDHRKGSPGPLPWRKSFFQRVWRCFQSSQWFKSWPRFLIYDISKFKASCPGSGGRGASGATGSRLFIVPMPNRSKKVNFRSFTAVESFVCHRLKAKPHGWLVSLEQLRQCYFPTAVSEDPANCSKYHHRNMYKDCQAFSNVDSNILIIYLIVFYIISMIMYSLPRKCAYLPSGI